MLFSNQDLAITEFQMEDLTENTLLDDCLVQKSPDSYAEPKTRLPRSIQQDTGHFNVYTLHGLRGNSNGDPTVAYPCRVNYKISLLKGSSRADYADKVIDIEPNALHFATPKVPFHWSPQGPDQTGVFCVFSAEFLLPTKSGVVLDELPIFKSGGYPIFQLSDDECARVQAIFGKMQEEMASDYAYKYDLLRTYVLELIHIGQKLQPATAHHPVHTASARVSSLFIELLERQFPITSPEQQLQLRTAKEYADRLAVHVNHLNKVLKETTGRTTTELITTRIMQEAKVLLKHADWTMAEIADSLGFADVAHFSNFFKHQTSVAPGAYRSHELV